LDVPAFLKGAVFSLYTKIGDADSVAIGKGTFDDNAHFVKQYTVSARVDSLLVYSEYVGLVDNIRLGATQTSVSFDYRPLYQNGASGAKRSDRPQMLPYTVSGKASFTFLDTFDSQAYRIIWPFRM
jgi:hypothetical protein